MDAPRFPGRLGRSCLAAAVLAMTLSQGHAQARATQDTDLLEQARTARQAGQFEASMHLARTVFDARLAGQGSAVEATWEAAAEYLGVCGWAGHAQSCLPEAEHWMTQAMAISETPTHAALLRSQASLFNRVGRFADSLLTLDRAAAVLERWRPSAEATWLAVQFARGVTLQNLNRRQESLDALDLALDGQRRLLGADDPTTLQTAARRATVLRQLGRREDSANQLGEVVRQLSGRDGPAASSTLQARLEWGFSLAELGRHAEAVRELESMVNEGSALFGPTHDLVLAGRYYLALQLSLMDEGDRSAELLSRLVEDSTRHLPAAHPDRITYLQALGIARQSQGRMQEALVLMEQANEQARTYLDPENEVRLGARINLIDAQLASGVSVDEAGLEEALATMRRLYGERHQHTLVIQGQQARRLSQLGRHAQALPLALQLWQDRRAFLGEDDRDTLQALALLGSTEARLGLDSAALRHLDELSRRLDGWRSALMALGPAAMRRGTEAFQSALAERIVLLARRGRLEDALGALEDHKARTLRSLMRQQRALAGAGLPAALIETLRDRLAQLSHLESMARGATQAEQREALWRQYHLDAQVLDEVLTRARSEHPRLESLLGARHGDWRSALARWPADELLVHLLEAGDHRWYALLVHGGRARSWVDLGSLPRLPQDLAELTEGLRMGRPSKVLLDRLSSQLLAPWAGALAGRHRLTVAADGRLEGLPWEALPWRDRPLVATVAVQHVPSLSASVVPPPPRRISHRLAYLGLAQGGAQVLQGRAWPAIGLAEQEVTEAARLWPEGDARVQLGEDASEVRLRQLATDGSLGRARVLHIATHGRFDPAMPSSLALVFRATNVLDSLQDGLVSAQDWMGWSLHSDLVVLSACDSARGEIVRGEGLQGFAQALRLAGNRQLLAARWPIHDRHASKFVLEVLRGVRHGQLPAAALAQVQRRWARSKDPRRAAPGTWAAFAMHGR